MFALSADPTAAKNNGENLDLEVAYPYNLVGDNSARYPSRSAPTTTGYHRNNADWDYDTIYAARLGLANEVSSGLVANTQKYQLLPSGMANLFGNTTSNEPYNEQTGIVAATLNEALVQDYDGLVRVAPAWPSTWDVDGTVSIQHNSIVDVQVRNGVPSTVVLEAGATAAFSVRSPWPGESVQVVDGASGHGGGRDHGRAHSRSTRAAGHKLPDRAVRVAVHEPAVRAGDRLAGDRRRSTSARSDRD